MKLTKAKAEAPKAGASRFTNLAPVQRFKGEFFILGLAIAVGVLAVFGPMAAFYVTITLALLQVYLLRNQRLTAESASTELKKAQAESQAWEATANQFMNELSSLKTQASMQDAETGLGNVRQFEADFGKQVARNHRKDEPFSVLLLQVRDTDHPDLELDAEALSASAEHLADSTRAEDTICRVARRGFAIILENCDRRGAEAYFERCRRRFDELPVNSHGRDLVVSLAGGVAEYDPAMTDFQGILRAAAQNLHARGRMRTQVRSA
ncbi:MAG: GGDEF domain-containing protein [Dehalococcoidia bacterium]